MDEANKFAFSFSLKFLFEGLGTIVVHFRMTCGRTGASASLLSCGRKERASLEGGSTRTCSCTRQQEEKEGAAGRIDALLPPAPTFFRFTPLRAPSLLTWTWPLWPTYSCGRTLCLSLSRCDEETLSTLFSGPVPSTYVSMGQLEQPLAAISLA